MSIFRRRKGADASTPPDGGDELFERPAPAPDAPGVEDGGDVGQAERSEGPFDVTEVDGPQGRVELGSIWMHGVEGMELRLEIDEQQERVIAATAVLAESAMQLQAFAAPRTGGLWEDIRGEIALSITTQGGTAETQPGAYGPELRATMPSSGPGGRTAAAPTRFLGVDGPRWFLRGVLSGRAAVDDAAAEPLLEVFRSVVVVRGGDPMAPRELLPLSLPEGPPEAPEDAPDQADEGEDHSSGLDPFERGPEITEVR